MYFLLTNVHYWRGANRAESMTKLIKQRNHRDAVRPELLATRPNEVWSWDITNNEKYNVSSPLLN